MGIKFIGKPMIIFFMLILILLVIGGIGLHFFSRRIQKDFTYSDEVFGNPLMGYAPSAWYDTVSNDVTLLYMDITWRELEPTEGVFDWESIEKENQLKRWREEGKHIVLRFVCDIPGEEEHMDIPDWLYEKIGGAGTKYHTSYGYGFAPDYNNKDFIFFHKKAVQALGEKYGKDEFISFIELGSLGHWGEWHVKSSAGIQKMPNREVRQQYVKHWVDAFPSAKILMRRPFAEAEQYGLGLYNDMAGHENSTKEWLEWIAKGGEYDQTGEKDAVVAMPDAWKTAPIGGEFTSSLEMKQMLVSDLKNTVSQIRDSHTTFLGPKIADRQFSEGYDAVLSNMGYRLWISDLEIFPKLSGGIQVDLTWRNNGVAPLYADWPVHLQVIDKDYRIVESAEVDITLSRILPGSVIRTSTSLKKIEKWKDLEEYTIKLGIADPETGDSAVRFAVKNADQYGNALVLWNPQ